MQSKNEASNDVIKKEGAGVAADDPQNNQSNYHSGERVNPYFGQSTGGAEAPPLPGFDRWATEGLLDKYGRIRKEKRKFKERERSYGEKAVSDKTDSPKDNNESNSKARVKKLRAVRDFRKERILPRRTLDFIDNGAPKGQRNDELFAAAGQMRDEGYSEDEACDTLIDAAFDCGLSEKESRSTINSAYNHERREPIGYGRAFQPHSREAITAVEPPVKAYEHDGASVAVQSIDPSGLTIGQAVIAFWKQLGIKSDRNILIAFQR